MKKNVLIFLSGLLVGAFFTWFPSLKKPTQDIVIDKILSREAVSQIPLGKSLKSTSTAPHRTSLPYNNLKNESAFTNKSKLESPLNIPQSLIYNINPLITSVNGLEISRVSVAGYGLDKDKSEKLVAFINAKAKEISDLEAANSTLVKDANGDEYYEIKSFKDKGNAIKNEISETIDATFSSFNDDRGLVFKRQLEAASIFEDYGESTRQIAIEQRINESGGVDLLFSQTRIKEGGIIDSSVNSLKVNRLKTRYHKIIEKNSNLQPTVPASR